MLRLLLLVSTVLPAMLCFGQGKFQINGKLKIDGGDLAGSRVVVYKNGEKERVISSGLNKLSLDLDMNASYLLSFEKDGFVSKKLSFNTKVPGAAATTTFTPFDFAVSLFKQYDDLNMVVFNQPVGVIRYEPDMNDFDYDTDYTKSIQKQLQQAIADVERKQKEEAQNAAADAKRIAAEEKAQAKAKAEADKQAEAQAKAKAEAEKQAEAQAKAKAEAEKQAEAQAKAKAEADKQAEAKAKAEAEKQAEAQAKAKAQAEERAAAQAKAEAQKREEEQARSKAQEEARAAETKKKEEEKARTEAVSAKNAAPPAQAKPSPAPPPAPMVAQEKVKANPTPPKKVQAGTTHATLVSGEGNRRREIEPVTGSETSPIRKAEMIADQEERPKIVEPEVWTDRIEELIVEPNKVVTIVQLKTDGSVTEYRKVIHKWGGTFYFKDGKTCSHVTYENEALGDRTAVATPRGKLDR